MVNMVYESSYESGGRKLFQPDTARGTWASPKDFIYSSLALSFKLDLFMTMYTFPQRYGILAVVLQLLCLALFVVPVLMLQVFVGQFSSSGFISAFRIAPISKGIGYASLIINVFALSFYSIFAAIPLLFFFNSFAPTLPWSCDGFSTWWQNFTATSDKNFCYANVTIEYTSYENNTESQYHLIKLPSVLWFQKIFTEEDIFDIPRADFTLSWEVTICNLIVWALIAFIFYKYFDTQKIAKLIRYAIWSILGVLTICFVRFVFLPGALQALKEFFVPELNFEVLYQIEMAPAQALSAFGAGWGSLICLASFNKFRTNIVRSSWLIALGQMLIYLLFAVVSTLLDAHFTEYLAGAKENYIMNYWNLYLSSATALGTLELPNFWSILYYFMLTSAVITLMVVQIYSILVSVFDDFVSLRAHKPQVTLGCIGILALFSIYFCSTHGVMHFAAFSMDALFVQIILYLLLMFVVLWIYGRERFQRDFEFMLGQPYATWKVNALRFVVPVFLLILLLMAMSASHYAHYFTTSLMKMFCAIITSGVWFFLPAYCIFFMLQTTGTIAERFKRCCRPMDWYPVDADERQRYEEAMGNMDITHQLNEVVDDIGSGHHI